MEGMAARRRVWQTPRVLACQQLINAAFVGLLAHGHARHACTWQVHAPSHLRSRQLSRAVSVSHTIRYSGTAPARPIASLQCAFENGRVGPNYFRPHTSLQTLRGKPIPAMAARLAQCPLTLLAILRWRVPSSYSHQKELTEHRRDADTQDKRTRRSSTANEWSTCMTINSERVIPPFWLFRGSVRSSSTRAARNSTGLRLKGTNWVDGTRLRRLLEEQHRHLVADHTVQRDRASQEYPGFCDLATYIDHCAPLIKRREQLQRPGAWVGEHVFGGLRMALRERARLPADGRRFDAVGLRLAYKGQAAVTAAKSGGRDRPVRANPLNLRRERYSRHEHVRLLKQIQSIAVDLRALKYGAARQTLRCETFAEQAALFSSEWAWGLATTSSTPRPTPRTYTTCFAY